MASKQVVEKLTHDPVYVVRKKACVYRKRRGERCSKLLPMVISGYVYRSGRVFYVLFLHFLSAVSLQLEHVNVSYPSF